MESKPQDGDRSARVPTSAADPDLRETEPEPRSAVLNGRRALVVGGSGGIGRAVSLGLAARGASLLVHGRTASKVETVVDAIRSRGGEAEGLALSLDSLAPLLEALDVLGARSAGNTLSADTAGSPRNARDRFDILVVAFGPFVRKSFADHSPSDWEKTALLDLALPGALAGKLFPAMCGRGFGRIIFFGGTRTDAIRGYRSNAAYAAAKTGLGVIAKSIAIEGAPHNVAAVVVCPGFVDTEYIDPEEKASLARIAPGGRLSDPAEVASIALDLIDRDPCPASGAIVSLDSGFSP